MSQVNSVKACKHKINKSSTKISAHYWIICLYSKNICFYVFITNKCSNLFWNMFYSERIKISKIIILLKQCNPMGSNIRVLIKIYYTCPILYFLWIISRVNTIKSRFILIIFTPWKLDPTKWFNFGFCADNSDFDRHLFQLIVP